METGSTNNSAIDFTDIKNWRVSLTKFNEHFQSKERRPVKSYRPLDVDAVKLYALFKMLPPHQPMGFYSFLLEGLPMGALVWWDFIVESDLGFIHVWRTSQTIEASVLVDDSSFDLPVFLNSNFRRYHKEIAEVIKGLEEISVYVNHFDSYKMSVDYLWGEIKDIDLTPPQIQDAHRAKNRAEIERIGDSLSAFKDRSLKFHVLGKSLLLNASFLIDSYTNLLIRVGAKRDLLENKSILDQHLASKFRDRLSNLKYYSAVLREPVNLEEPVVSFP